MQGVVMSLSTSSIQISNLSFKKITFCKSLLTSCLCFFFFFKSEEIHEDIILKSENYQKPSQISMCLLKISLLCALHPQRENLFFHEHGI